MKKAFLSIATLLTIVTISGCGEQASSAASSTSSEGTTTSEGNSSSSSSVDVYTYSLSVTAPEKTVYETGDVFEFSTIEVKETTFVNGNSRGEVLLKRDEYVVKVNGQVIDGDFTFASEGQVEFVISSKEHSDATNSFTLQAVTYYSITNASDDKVILTSLPNRSLANETITFGLTLLPGYYFEGTLSIVDGASNQIEFTEENYQYTFKMPASNVTISVTTDLNDFTISKDSEIIGDVVLESGDDTSDVFSAVPGTRLKFKASESVDFTFTEIYMDGVVLEKGDDDFYHFEMPHHPVKLTTNKSPRFYSITSNVNELTISKSVMYVDSETKTPITSAYKGQRVYLEFSYDVVLVKYEISVKDATNASLEVKQVEGQDIFYFDMISSDITIEVKEDDYSKYYGYYVTEKNYKTFELYCYGTTNEIGKKSFADLKGLSYKFDSNGKGLRGLVNMTWSYDGNKDDTSGHIVAKLENSSADKDFYFTKYLLISKFGDYANSKWNDAYVGTWDENVDINYLYFEGDNRLVWVEDTEGNIIDKLLIFNNELYLDFNVYSDANRSIVCKGNDVTIDGDMYFSITNEFDFDYIKGASYKSYNINKNETDEYTLTIKDSEGKEITEAKNGQTVTVVGSLTASATEQGLGIKSLVAKNGTSTITVTKSQTQENTWSFVMPKGDVELSLQINNPNKYKGYSAVGKYIGYEIWSSTSGDKTIDERLVKNYEIMSSGSFNNNGTKEDIKSLDNADYGKMTASREWSFGNGVIASPYYSNGNKNDSYIAFKVDDDFDFSEHTVTSKVHWISSGSSYAVEFFVDGTFKAGIFMTNSTYYCGVTFTYDGTDRVGSTGTYHVVYNGQTIFDVTGTTVTAHQE